MVISTGFLVGLVILIFLVAIWDLIWKGIGMWKAGRNNQLVWFIVIFLINTIGILPIVYLLWFQKKKK
jgi:hypothetical protein